MVSVHHAVRHLEDATDREIEWVATRMRQTLMEVLGREHAESLYSLEWLRARVRWHLDLSPQQSRVFVAENALNDIVGHAIARIEVDDHGNQFGYFSTIWVESSTRRLGVASSLVAAVMEWCTEIRMPRVVYNTAADNAPLLKLLEHHGFRITLRDNDMVQLTQVLYSVSM